jgi:hypothetical protein
MQPIAPFLEPLKALEELLGYYPERGLIIGGIAASLLGTPRLTADIGALILLSVSDLAELFARAKEVGFLPRLENAEEFARKSRVLLLKHAESEISIDISLGLLPFEEEAVANGQKYFFEGVTLSLPIPEDLIIMKTIAHRPKDILDIEGIIKNHPHLDKPNSRLDKSIRRIVRQA